MAEAKMESAAVRPDTELAWQIFRIPFCRLNPLTLLRR